jgi:hypothetical protein
MMQPGEEKFKQWLEANPMPEVTRGDVAALRSWIAWRQTAMRAQAECGVSVRIVLGEGA